MKESAKGILQLIWVVGFIVSAVVISRILQYSQHPPQTHEGGQRTLYVNAQTYHAGSQRVRFTTSGVVQARGSIEIVPQVSGRLVHMNPNFFTDGTFKKDELLFQVERSDFRNRVKQLESEVASAETALELEKAESEAALDEWQLLNPNQAPTALVARKPQLNEANAALKSAKAQLSNAQLDLKRTRYTLPFNGRVINSSLAMGQYVNAGQNYGEVFNIDSLEVRASLNESQLKWLLASDNNHIDITADYLGQHYSYTGALLRSAASLNSTTRFSTAVFGFAKTATNLVPGVFTQITIEGPQIDNVIKLPSSAMQKEGYVWSIDSEQKLKSHKPDILYEDESSLVIRAFANEATIVTSQLAGAQDGMQAKVRETP